MQIPPNVIAGPLASPLSTAKKTFKKLARLFQMFSRREKSSKVTAHSIFTSHRPRNALFRFPWPAVRHAVIHGRSAECLTCLRQLCEVRATAGE
ncbi:hypothetical protein GWI33_006773 [Rhynchophorus ferrugineus]|uniref:Uncharacterized protein n=1 Tax=Rhynchophorus ferrugineus TaxID=354439 RepID=A0A834IF97_RHYFE|nr:hypothetical protein GWI33_006773 [Rhynchophorus ferrugineus]